MIVNGDKYPNFIIWVGHKVMDTQVLFEQNIVRMASEVP